MEDSSPGTGSRDVTQQTKQQTQHFAQQARQQATQLANRGSEQVKSQLANQKHQATQRMTPVQTALRETGQQLRKQGQGPVAQYADNAADQVERFSRYLRENDVDQLIGGVQSFARRRPALFLGSAVTLGFLGTRFLKSSSQQVVSAGDGSSATLAATSKAAVYHGTEQPTTTLPQVSVEGEAPTARRLPTQTGQPLSERERTDPPDEPTEPLDNPLGRE
jgi:hypothetical protein